MQHTTQHPAEFSTSLFDWRCNTDWLIKQGLTSHQTHYRSYRGWFLQVIWPNQQCQSTEENQLVFQIRLESHQHHLMTFCFRCAARIPLLTYNPAEYNNLSTTADVSHLFRFDAEEHLKSFQCNDTNALPHFRLVFHDEAVFQVEKQAVKRRRLRAVKYAIRTRSLQTQ